MFGLGTMEGGISGFHMAFSVLFSSLPWSHVPPLRLCLASALACPGPAPPVPGLRSASPAPWRRSAPPAPQLCSACRSTRALRHHPARVLPLLCSAHHWSLSPSCLMGKTRFSGMKMLKLEQLQFLGRAIYHLSFVSAGECCWSLSFGGKKSTWRESSAAFVGLRADTILHI